MDEAKQLLIPEKLKVGFQKREGTYTGKLAFVVYYDGKGVLRKEKSWEGWRHKNIKAEEYTNEPTEGFVLNKSGGGSRNSYHSWNPRNEFIRVYDPRGFEFEISLPNLLFILRETDCSRGKGLEGKFVYAWDGQELVLLPAGSEDYKHSKNFTALQTKTVSFKDMVPGTTFTTKRQEDLTFLGKFDHHFMYQPDGYRASAKKDASGKDKRFVFWSDEDKRFVFLKELKTIAVLKSDVVHPDFADLVAKYGKSENGSPVTELFLKEVPSKQKENYGNNESWFYEESPGVFVEATTRFKYNQGWTDQVEYIQTQARYSVEKGVLVKRSYNTTAYAPGVSPARNYGYSSSPSDSGTWHEPTTHRLFAKTEGGGKVRVTYDTFKKD